MCNIYLGGKKEIALPKSKTTIISSKIRELIYDFASIISEIITDMPYLCEPEVSKQRGLFFSFPFV